MRSILKRLSMWAIIVGMILMVPLVAMQFTNEVAWTPRDFITAGALLFGAGMVYLLATRNMSKARNRIAIGIAVVAALLYVWAELAVGIFTKWGS